MRLESFSGPLVVTRPGARHRAPPNKGLKLTVRGGSSIEVGAVAIVVAALTVAAAARSLSPVR